MNKHIDDYGYQGSPKEPWWNDRDKAGGLAATIFLLSFVIFLACLLIAAGVAMMRWAF